MDVPTHTIEVARNGDWRRSFQIVDEDDVPFDITGATIDLDVQLIRGQPGASLVAVAIEMVDEPEGMFAIEIAGSDFDGLGNPLINTRFVYDLVITQDGEKIPLLKGDVLVLPGVSDNAD